MPTVLLTGAARGLGLEFTKIYAARGWKVLACARKPDAAIPIDFTKSICWSPRCYRAWLWA